MRLALAVALVLLSASCSQAFFYPDGTVAETPARLGLAYVPLKLRAADGTALSAWFMPARGKALASVLYLHGNSRNMGAHLRQIAWLPAAGFNVLALDYRGFGNSEGLPSFGGIQLDVDAAMQAMLSRADIDPDRIIVFGQSLGAAVAIHYVAHSAYRSHVRAVIADSPFADYRLIASDKISETVIGRPFMRWLPEHFIDNEYSPRASVSALSPIPLLLIHGERDTTVAPYHSKLLYQTANEPKELWSIPDAGHIQALRNERIRRRLADFLVEAATPPGELPTAGVRTKSASLPRYNVVP